MSVKSNIAGIILCLTLIVASVNLVYSAVAADPASSGSVSTSQWKSIPEDTTSWRREPFKSTEVIKHGAAPSVKQDSLGTVSDLALQGIMKSNKRYYTIINGNTLKTGDHIDGWTIADISRHRVTLRREKEMQIYDIYQGRIDRGTR